MAKRREAGIMGTSIFMCLFIILLTGGSPAGCADDEGSASHGTAENAKLLALLNNTADVKAFISGAEVAVIGFFQELDGPEVSEFRRAASLIPEVPFGLSTSPAMRSQYNATASTLALFRRADDDRRYLDIIDEEEISAEKMVHFIRMNELRLVTEYNPVTAIGLLHSSVQFHLLLITDKRSPEHPERMRRFLEAAELFQGKILFVLVDSNMKSNERVLSFFKLKKSQLPALAIFHTPDDEQDVLPLDEVSIERVQDFCNIFLQRKQKKRNQTNQRRKPSMRNSDSSLSPQDDCAQSHLFLMCEEFTKLH
ncbi:endoplasmic reticulum resident protein 27 [Rhea pennata]|uniref:endoplasmic reticulum resident protein 27 n=1 Tax=Rhea pennata TaxID=8795 RepID=UPI002E2594F3